MKNKQMYFSSTRITVIALFAALAAVLYVWGFPLSVLFPGWLELNFSDIPMLIGTFALGPVSGSIIVALKIVLKLLMKPTSSVFVGELADLLIGLSFVVPAGMIYQKRRTFKGALLSLAIGSLCSIIMSILANWLILIPFYVNISFQGDWSFLLRGIQVIFPACTQDDFYTFYLWGSVLPFNLLRCAIAVAVTLPVYKHVSRLINRLSIRMTPKNDESGEKSKKINLGVLIGAIVLILIFILIILFRLFEK